MLRTNSVGEPVYASPAIANGTIYIRGDKHLFAIGKHDEMTTPNVSDSAQTCTWRAWELAVVQSGVVAGAQRQHERLRPGWPQWRGPSRNGTRRRPRARRSGRRRGSAPGASTSARATRRRSSPAAACSSTAAAIPTSSSRPSISRPARSRGSRSTRRRSTRTSTRPTMAKGPHATPLVDRRQASFTLGGIGVVSAWNAQTGALAWRKDYSASVDTSKLFTGTAASPLREGGLGDRPGRQRRARRAHHRARSADRRRALDVDGQGPGLRLAGRRHRRRRRGRSSR